MNKTITKIAIKVQDNENKKGVSKEPIEQKEMASV